MQTPEKAEIHFGTTLTPSMTERFLDRVFQLRITRASYIRNLIEADLKKARRTTGRAA